MRKKKNRWVTLYPNTLNWKFSFTRISLFKITSQYLRCYSASSIWNSIDSKTFSWFCLFELSVTCLYTPTGLGGHFEKDRQKLFSTRNAKKRCLLQNKNTPRQNGNWTKWLFTSSAQETRVPSANDGWVQTSKKKIYISEGGTGNKKPENTGWQVCTINFHL